MAELEVLKKLYFDFEKEIFEILEYLPITKYNFESTSYKNALFLHKVCPIFEIAFKDLLFSLDLNYDVTSQNKLVFDKLTSIYNKLKTINDGQGHPSFIKHIFNPISKINYNFIKTTDYLTCENRTFNDIVVPFNLLEFPYMFIEEEGKTFTIIWKDDFKLIWDKYNEKKHNLIDFDVSLGDILTIMAMLYVVICLLILQKMNRKYWFEHFLIDKENHLIFRRNLNNSAGIKVHTLWEVPGLFDSKLFINMFHD